MVFLRSLELFKGLDETELALVQRCCGGGLAFSQGDRLFTEGEDAGAFFALVEGAVELRFELPGRPSEKARTVLSVGSGEILGWSAVVPPFRYTLSAICVSERCEVLRYHRGDFIQTLEHHSHGRPPLSRPVREVRRRARQRRDRRLVREWVPATRGVFCGVPHGGPRFTSKTLTCAAEVDLGPVAAGAPVLA
jgi:CRP-like cAMP-binding protein